MKKKKTKKKIEMDSESAMGQFSLSALNDIATILNNSGVVKKARIYRKSRVHMANMHQMMKAKVLETVAEMTQDALKSR